MYLFFIAAGYLIGLGIYFKLKRNSKLKELAHFEFELSLIKGDISQSEQRLLIRYGMENDQILHDLDMLRDKKKWTEEQIALARAQWPHREYFEWDTYIALIAALSSVLVLIFMHSDYFSINSMLEEQKYLESITYDNIIDNGLIEINEEIRDWNSELMRNRALESTWFLGQFMPKIYLEEDGYGLHLIEYKVKD